MSLFYRKLQDGSEEVRYSAVVGTIALALVGLIFLIALFAAFPFKKVPRDQVGLSYGGGAFEGATFQGVHDPGSSMFFNGWGDRLYLYPVTQRSYIITQTGEGDVQGTIVASSQDRIAVGFEVATYFKLNLNLVRDFHETIGLKYRAWEDEGWNQMLAESFRQQIEFALQREARKYAVADLYSNDQTLQDIQHAIGTTLQTNVTEVLGKSYFCGVEYEAGDLDCPDFTFVIRHVTIPDEVKKAFESNRTSEIAIVTRENEVKQAELEAEAIAKRQEALESCGQTCILYEAIQSGGITFWVIPDGQTNLTIPAGGTTPGA